MGLEFSVLALEILRLIISAAAAKRSTAPSNSTARAEFIRASIATSIYDASAKRWLNGILAALEQTERAARSA
jgi:hypothetical protein